GPGRGAPGGRALRDLRGRGLDLRGGQDDLVDVRLDRHVDGFVTREGGRLEIRLQPQPISVGQDGSGKSIRILGHWLVSFSSAGPSYRDGLVCSWADRLSGRNGNGRSHDGGGFPGR